MKKCEKKIIFIYEWGELHRVSHPIDHLLRLSISLGKNITRISITQVIKQPKIIKYWVR